MSSSSLLEEKIKDISEETPELNTGKLDKFELAVAQITNVRLLGGLDSEELVSGIVGGGGDEGIDMCYLFHNNEIIRNEEDFNQVKINKSSDFQLKLFQVKSANGFSVNEFSKFCDGVKTIITLEHTKLIKLKINQELLEKVKVIRKALKSSKREGAKFQLNIFFVSKGDKQNLESKIEKIKEDLKTDLSLYIDDINFEFLGATELINMDNILKDKIELIVEPTIIDLRDPNKKIQGYACFVKGSSVLNSLVDTKTKQLKDEFFDTNVRDYLGERKLINESIIQTAQEKEGIENFWAMNNGITIVGDAVRSVSSTCILIENPQIINGCQTIYSLHSASRNKKLPDGLKVFVKMIQVGDPQIQQDIINASNSQNTVDYTSFRANDTIQRHIEKFLSSRGCYYERRANYYKRKGKKGLDVISIKKMSQIIQAIFLKESIKALNDVRKIFDNENLYSKIFNTDTDYNAYLFAHKLYKKIWVQKNLDLRKNKFTQENKDLLSKSFLPLLHISSSLVFQRQMPVIFKEGKKNEFSTLQENATSKMDLNIEEIYENAKKIYFDSVKKYKKNTGKNAMTLLKQRSFDKEYIVPEISKFLKKKV